MNQPTDNLPAAAASPQPCEDRPEPKFRQGQVVILKNKSVPFRVLDVIWEDGWFYAWSKRNYAHEPLLRELDDVDLHGESLAQAGRLPGAAGKE